MQEPPVCQGRSHRTDFKRHRSCHDGRDTSTAKFLSLESQAALYTSASTSSEEFQISDTSDVVITNFNTDRPAARNAAQQAISIEKQSRLEQRKPRCFSSEKHPVPRNRYCTPRMSKAEDVLAMVHRASPPEADKSLCVRMAPVLGTLARVKLSF